MKLHVNEKQFDQHQGALLSYLMQGIRDTLTEEGVEQTTIQSLTEKLAFGVAAAIDGSQQMEHQGQPLTPVLTFAEGEEQLLTAGAGSWMHEYVYGCSEELFDHQHTHAPSHEDVGHTDYYQITLRFNGDLSVQVDHDINWDDEDLIDTLGDALIETATGQRPVETNDPRLIVRDISPRFATIETIEFSNDGANVLYTLDRADLAAQSLELLAQRILVHISAKSQPDRILP